MSKKGKILKGYSEILMWIMLGAFAINIITLFVPAFYAEIFFGSTYESGINFLGFNLNADNPLGVWCVDSVFLHEEALWQMLIKFELFLMFWPTVMPLLLLSIKKNINDEGIYAEYKYTMYRGAVGFSFVFNSIYMITVFLLCFFTLNEGNFEPVVTYTYIPWLIQLGVFIAAQVIKNHCTRAMKGEVAPLRTVSENIEASPKPEEHTFSENDKVELLIKYKELLENGVITEEEYQQKKQEIMSGK